MQIFDELKARGIEDLGILSIDGVSGLEEGAKAIFPNVHRTALHCPSRTKLDSVYPQEAVECFHEAAERDLWGCKRGRSTAGFRAV